MSDGNAALALALGAGAGLGLWYLLRDDDDKNPAAAPPAATSTTTAATASATARISSPPVVRTAPPPRTAGPCTLRLDAIGLTADGLPINVAGAVARCRAAGRAELTYDSKHGPAQVYLDLNTALSKAGIAVTVRAA